MALSDIARIREQITLEYQAAQRVFREPAIVSRHDFIEQRQVQLGKYFAELRKYLSPEQALEVFIGVEKEKVCEPQKKD
ncbi:hypothetical protein EPA93_21180 [Ktedonosporobacter rubrisoli]|uniref:Uncharacterized protein n=1 Tax=Ktedonosporobacter rubrisoli TaxID=2509675 RepID=A0A4P6JSI9_KTERU|nr:hypothetical protein [Ktedonosporobacter rubrisoli]QBD78374.1 hypothetical protein EPA93_21180 [Ktedonosporobacter rubrisoli]